MTAPPQTLGKPDAEFEVDVDLARALLAAQHPDLAELPITPVASGWDNAIFRLGDDLALRLPRRAVAVDLLRNEQRWLPLLAPRLPLPVPTPIRIGRAQDGFPWPWSITPWLDGETADIAPPDETQGDVLAAFFRALHQPAPADAPRNPVRGVPLMTRAKMFDERARSIPNLVPPGIFDLWASALATPIDVETTWLHGDPHPRNMLVRDGGITAVIDWGDMAQGDQASDLASLWMVLPDLVARKRAMAALGRVSEATWRRARGWAASFGVVWASAGMVNEPSFIVIGQAIFARLLEGP
jgi:aminoglycoside phosphotransferase (APT) family kinase protein